MRNKSEPASLDPIDWRFSCKLEASKQNPCPCYPLQSRFTQKVSSSKLPFFQASSFWWNLSSEGYQLWSLGGGGTPNLIFYLYLKVSRAAVPPLQLPFIALILEGQVHCTMYTAGLYCTVNVQALILKGPKLTKVLNCNFQFNVLVLFRL